LTGQASAFEVTEACVETAHRLLDPSDRADMEEALSTLFAECCGSDEKVEPVYFTAKTGFTSEEWDESVTKDLKRYYKLCLIEGTSLEDDLEGSGIWI